MPGGGDSFPQVVTDALARWNWDGAELWITSLPLPRQRGAVNILARNHNEHFVLVPQAIELIAPGCHDLMMEVFGEKSVEQQNADRFVVNCRACQALGHRGAFVKVVEKSYRGWYTLVRADGRVCRGSRRYSEQSLPA